MTPKTISFFILAFFAIIGWNIFLIQRDSKMFDAYDKQVAIEREKDPTFSLIGKWCKIKAGWHPDCNTK